jgi:hypothetical protein
MNQRRAFTFALGAALAGFSVSAKAQELEGAQGGTGFRISLIEGDDGRPAPRDRWARGYSQAELDAAQEKFGLVFPPDLVALLRDRRPAQGYDWRSDETVIRAMLRRPLEGLIFDVENNALWLAEWGERPTAAPERAEALAEIVGAAPRLIPLYLHRYLPAEPHEAGNPVFSVQQSDIIYYGADLADYFEREFVTPGRPLGTPTKRIRFWSDLVERNG